MDDFICRPESPSRVLSNLSFSAERFLDEILKLCKTSETFLIVNACSINNGQFDFITIITELIVE